MTRRINGDALQNRAGTAATGDVFVFDDAHADGGEWQAPGAGSASAAWPVGSIFLSAVATDPATLLGFGTWSAIGAGRVLIGDNGGTYPLGATGGAETSSHSHGAGTLLPSAHPSHSHNTSTSTNMTITAHSGTAVDAHSGTAVANHVVTQPATHDSHVHTYGTLAVDSHPEHEHWMDQWPSHSHPITGSEFAHTHIVAAGQGSHQHGMAEGTTDGSGTYMDRSNASAATTAQTDLATLPQLNVSSANLPDGNTENSGYTGAVTGGVYTYPGGAPMTLSHTVSGSTGSNSTSLSHSGTAVDAHAVTQPNNHVVTQPSAHTIGGNTDGHTLAAHTMSGSTGSDSPSVVQPYLVVAMWQRVS